MQVSIYKIIDLVAGRSDPLTRAACAVLGDRAADAGYSLTQDDADEIAKALDQASADNLPGEQWLVELTGSTAEEIQYETATKITAAVGHARTIFAMAGLHTPARWLD